MGGPPANRDSAGTKKPAVEAAAKPSVTFEKKKRIGGPNKSKRSACEDKTKTTTTKNFDKAETCGFHLSIFVQSATAARYPGRWFLSTVTAPKAFKHNLHEHHFRQDILASQQRQQQTVQVLFQDNLFAKLNAITKAIVGLAEDNPDAGLAALSEYERIHLAMTEFVKSCSILDSPDYAAGLEFSQTRTSKNVPPRGCVQVVSFDVIIDVKGDVLNDVYIDGEINFKPVPYAQQISYR
jgi:hypothetical protein